MRNLKASTAAEYWIAGDPSGSHLARRISHTPEFRYCLRQTLSLCETNSQFEDQFRWTYFKLRYTQFTRRCPVEQEEFAFWKNRIRLIRLSFRLSPASDFYLLTKPTSSTTVHFAVLPAQVIIFPPWSCCTYAISVAFSSPVESLPTYSLPPASNYPFSGFHPLLGENGQVSSYWLSTLSWLAVFLAH